MGMNLKKFALELRLSMDLTKEAIHQSHILAEITNEIESQQVYAMCFTSMCGHSCDIHIGARCKI